MEQGIIEALESYLGRVFVRMHMPGHKGKGVGKKGGTVEKLLDAVRAVDVTEVSGLDNLHYPSGCLREAERFAERIFGTKRSYFLVNGASSGVHASLLAVRMLKGRGKVAVPRNAHKSLISAMALSGMEPVFMYPSYDRELGGFLPVTTAQVEKVLSSPDIKAVFLQNPTYSGFSGNLTGIADICRAENLIFIVDEAHGTHFRFGRNLPDSALDTTADIVIHGAHKTTVALTQTGLLHVGQSAGSDLLNAVEECLRVVQTTSPSYVLMASLEQALRLLVADGGAWVNAGTEGALRLAARISDIEGIHVSGYGTTLQGGLKRDPGKILVRFPLLGITGKEAARFLLEEGGLESEMAGLDDVLLMWTGSNGEDDAKAVLDSLKRLANRPFGEKVIPRLKIPAPLKRMGLRDAFLSDAQPVSLDIALHRIAADTVVVYPPGSPIIVPGETVDEQVIDYIIRARELGLNVVGRGVDGSKRPQIFCVKR